MDQSLLRGGDQKRRQCSNLGVIIVFSAAHTNYDFFPGRLVNFGANICLDAIIWRLVIVPGVGAAGTAGEKQRPFFVNRKRGRRLDSHFTEIGSWFGKGHVKGTSEHLGLWDHIDKYFPLPTIFQNLLKAFGGSRGVEKQQLLINATEKRNIKMFNMINGYFNDLTFFKKGKTNVKGS